MLNLQDRVLFARAQVQGLGFFIIRPKSRCSGQRIIIIPYTRRLYLIQPSVGSSLYIALEFYMYRFCRTPWDSLNIRYRNWAMSATGTSEGSSSPIRSSTWTLGTVNPWGLVSFLGIMRTRLHNPVVVKGHIGAFTVETNIMEKVNLLGDCTTTADL